MAVIQRIRHWLTCWIIGNWVNIRSFSRLLYACITSLNFLKALLELGFLILLTNLELNTLLLYGISLGLTSSKTPFLSNPLISF